MVKLMRRNLDWWAVITATIFLGFQVVCDLSLPNLTSNLINNGVAKGNVGYIWQIGLQMLGLTLVGILQQQEMYILLLLKHKKWVPD